MISTEIWVIIGVVVGAILGFLLNLSRYYIQEKQQRRKCLKDLLADLEYNKKLAEETKRWGYHTLGYNDAKGAKYLFDLPMELRNQIYDVQTIISAFYLYQKDMNYPLEIEKLKEFLESLIPKFERYLRNLATMNKKHGILIESTLVLLFILIAIIAYIMKMPIFTPMGLILSMTGSIILAIWIYFVRFTKEGKINVWISKSTQIVDEVTKYVGMPLLIIGFIYQLLGFYLTI